MDLAYSMLVIGLVVALVLAKLQTRPREIKKKPLLPIAQRFDPLSFLRARDQPLQDPEFALPVHAAQSFDLKHSGFIHNTRSRKILKA